MRTGRRVEHGLALLVVLACPWWPFLQGQRVPLVLASAFVVWPGDLGPRDGPAPQGPGG